jgi:2-methylisocitrate lyase-like PEP mutase family enzyme
MKSVAHRRAALARRVRSRELITVPGVFDLISAAVADRLGFEEIWAFDERWAEPETPR